VTAPNHTNDVGMLEAYGPSSIHHYHSQNYHSPNIQNYHSPNILYKFYKEIVLGLDTSNNDL
jgi:hypothetical protein